jgi:DNA-binding NarL/FixJ family response regulator
LEALKIKVIIVEDEPILLEEFKNIIQNDPNFSVIGTASSLRAGCELVRKNDYDVLLCDLGLPDGSGIEIIKLSSALRPSADSMVISLFGDEERVINSMEAGAKGYILKDDRPDDFIKAIIDLRKGYSPLSPKIARVLLRRFQLINPAVKTKSPLTLQESRTLSLIAEGKSTKAVAKDIGISEFTVADHCKNIYKKLGVHTRTEAAMKGKEQGWI